MKIDSLKDYDIPEDFIEKFKQQNIFELNEPQVKSLKNGLLDFENQIISAPTASGKTLIATLATIKKLKIEGSKVLYLVPLIALAGEKWKYYRKLFQGTGIRVAISTGDFDSTSQWLANYDLIILTTEKCDSLMRHEADWIRDVGLVIVDEIHLLHDPSRGPTLEITLTRLRETLPNSQIIGLSATISNADEIAKWLDAKSIKSDYRSVQLHEGIYLDNKLQFFGRNGYGLNEKLSAEQSILESTIKLRKQSLYFVSTRRNSESLAEKLGKFNRTFLGKNEKEELSKLSDQILNILESPTRQCKKLSDCVKNGIAFHHAGVLGKQKDLIEDNFRNGLLKSICATPTLCLAKNSVVWSRMTDIQVQDLRKNDSLFVLSENRLISMKPQKVRKITNFSKLIKLTTVSGHSIILTSNHKILVKRDRKKKIMQIKDCKKSEDRKSVV